MSEAKSQRLFFALWPDAERRQAIAQVAAGVLGVDMDAKGRLVPQRNLHATLLFLGQVAVDRFAEIIAVAQAVTAQAFEVHLDRLEVWRDSEALVLASSQTPAGFAVLVDALRRRLNESGFAVEVRPPRLHVTLARKVMVQDLLPLDVPVTWRADDFALVQSETLSMGSEYTVLRRWPLA